MPSLKMLIIGLVGGWMIGGAGGSIPLVLSAFVVICVISFSVVLWAWTGFWKDAIEREDREKRSQKD